jgi:branched-chain amino acid transport system permease protein
MPALRLPLPAWLAVGLAVALVLPETGWLSPYLLLVVTYVGINMILAVSLNLVNGYMGEFSVGHAGFMAVGAYTASVLTVWVFPRDASPWLFPLALLAGGAAAAVAGLGLAFPSFRTRGDYLAIVTLAFLMIVKSVLENMPSLGGPRGFMGMDRLTTLGWVFGGVVFSVWLARNLVYSRWGRGVLSIREDETAAGLVGVDTQRVKVVVFTVSAFLAGLAGGLFAHAIQFINPRSFTLLKSTDMLVMVYLGGIGSLGGSLLGATVYTLVLEGLRPALQSCGISQEWRLVFAPLLLILLMLKRPKGILGFRELAFLRPRGEREVPGAPR